MKVRYKYLDDLGIKRERYGSNFIKDQKIQRFIERRKYGFDHRQTVNMDLIFAEWLYSRLMMLLEQTMDDLTFHSVDFEGNTYTIEQAIHRILNATKEYIWYHEMIMGYCDRVVVSKKLLRRWEKDEYYKQVGDDFIRVDRIQNASDE